MYDIASDKGRVFRNAVRWFVATLWLFAAQSIYGADAAGPKVLIVYPEAADRYKPTFSHVVDVQAVYDRIIDGIRSRIDTETIAKSIPEGSEAQLSAWVNQQQPVKAVISLGPNAFRRISNLPPTIPLYVGASSMPSQPGVAGVDRHINPQLFLNTLKRLTPSIRNIVFVFNPSISAGVVDTYEKTAKRNGYQFSSLPITTARQAISDVSNLLTTIDPTTTAIWFGDDALTINKELLLPLILEKSWRRHIVTFSSDPGDVRRGLLFALYPDFYQLGRELAERVITEKEGFSLVEAAKVAINFRTARHLGAQSRGLDRIADTIFPSVGQ